MSVVICGPSSVGLSGMGRPGWLFGMVSGAVLCVSHSLSRRNLNYTAALLLLQRHACSDALAEFVFGT